MSESKHTPGPWITNGLHIFGPCDGRSKHPNGRVLIGGVVDDANDWRGVPFDSQAERAEFQAERLANAALIAAAPDLIAALKEALPVLEFEAEARGDSDHLYEIPVRPILRVVLAAIARAEGRSDE